MWNRWLTRETLVEQAYNVILIAIDKVRLSDFRFQPHEGFEYVYDLARQLGA